MSQYLFANFQYGIIPKSVMKDTSINIKAKGLYAYLCSYAGSDGSAFPSRNLILHELGIGKEAFYSAMESLKSSGYIESYQRTKGNGTFGSNVYVLLDPSVKPDSGEPCTGKPDTDRSDTTINNSTINNNTNNNKSKRKRFVPPKVDEVDAYCKERGNTVNPEAFVDFYESKGWMVGKNKMKSWKAAVRTWERSRKSDQSGENKYEGTIYDID